MPTKRYKAPVISATELRRSISKAEGNEEKMSVSDIRGALKQGRDAQDLLDTLIGHILGNEPFASDELLMTLEGLVKHGARVASKPQGSAIEHLVRAKKSEWLIAKMADQVADIPGEVPAHIVARVCPGMLCKIIHQEMMDNVSQCLQKRDHLGRSVSHYLWDPDSTMVQQSHACRNAKNEEAENQEALIWAQRVSEAWKLQTELESHAGLDAVDNQGVPAWRLCLDRIQAEDALLFPNIDVCKKFKAYQDGVQMDQLTPPAPSPAIAQRRM